MARLAEIFEDMASEEQSSKLYMAGTAQLTHQQAIGIADLAPIFDALEEQVVLMKLMSALSEVRQSHGVSVAIGSETHTPGLVHAAVVTSGYGHSTRRANDNAQMVADNVFGSAGDASGIDDAETSDVPRMQSMSERDDVHRDDVAAQLSITQDREPVAFVGSIGPTHMDYAATIAAVQAVARYLTTCIAQDDDSESS